MSVRLWLLPVFLLVAVDQLSKYWVETALPLYQRVDLLPFLSLFRIYNEGIAFSFLSDLGAVPLIILTILIIFFVLWLWRGLEEGRWISALGYSLIIAGALGNLIDRIRLGKVIDMIFFHIDYLRFEFAVFNLADTFITLGALAIITDEYLNWRAGREEKTDRKTNPENDTGKT